METATITAAAKAGCALLDIQNALLTMVKEMLVSFLVHHQQMTALGKWFINGGPAV